ncbi:hypothetical protein RGR602_PC00406 (plasmid) [Rhizobium gallicum bv. gallicum R602sp]|uniref:Uncharacterized protein n=1 Tax=Rhizobium gallicum bv. gallicum R602sp TaxID=1041138 RepID=A0A0B4XBL0_9HYPH|nr:hypothetical protein RGR602_PC00406 [Rhizobium gallicum bv. gallicum R602sp]
MLQVANVASLSKAVNSNFAQGSPWAKMQADWRKPTGQGLGQFMGEHLPFYGNLFVSFAAARG